MILRKKPMAAYKSTLKQKAASFLWYTAITGCGSYLVYIARKIPLLF